MIWSNLAASHCTTPSLGVLDTHHKPPCQCADSQSIILIQYLVSSAKAVQSAPSVTNTLLAHCIGSKQIGDSAHNKCPQCPHNEHIIGAVGNAQCATNCPSSCADL